MGLFAFLVRRKPSRRLSIGDAPLRCRAAIETLEQRVLLTTVVQLNSPGLDVAGTVPSIRGNQDLAAQSETTNITFSPPASNDRTVVAYNDGAMARFGEASGSAMHTTGWAYSDTGGASVVQPNSNAADPALLPTVSNGTQITGDDANHSLAWSNANATLYMANTSWPNQSDINVYASTDGGHTFTAGVDATPGAPTAWGTTTATYDKPSLAVDSYLGTGDGTGYGALYLAYVENVFPQGTDYNQIVITSLAPGAPFASTSWPTPLNQNAPPGSVLATGNVQSPEVLVEPDHSVDVIYATQYGIYLVHSISPLSQNGWSNPQSKQLVAFQHTNGSKFWSDDLYADTGDGTKETIVDIPHYPSAAIGQVGTHTYLYVAYMDGNLNSDTNEPDGTFGIYFLQYDLSTGTPVGNANGPFGPIARTGAVTDEWMPSLALSPDGSHAFIGFYGGNAVYDPNSQKADEQYNTFYITGATDTGGINWSGPTQITNVDGTGQPTGGYFDQWRGPSLDSFANPADPPSVWNPDYDGASADFQNFYYSYMETTPGSASIPYEEDAYMASVPIPYTDTAPTAPGVVSFTPGTNQGNLTLTVRWSGDFSNFPNAYAYAEYSSDGQGWVPFGSTGTLAANDYLTLQSGDQTFSNYSPAATYYFRVRVQGVRGLGHDSSPWSSVFVAPGSNTMVFYGTPASDTIHITEDPVHNQIDYTIGGVSQPAVSIISGGSLLVLGGGGDDTIIFDLSNGNFLAAAGNAIDNDGGSMILKLIGTTPSTPPSPDTVSIVGGGNAPYKFDGTYVNVVAGLLDSLEYDDKGDGGTISVSGCIPVMVNLSTGDSTVTNSDSARVFVVPGTGKITLNANAGATIFPASTTNTGIRDVYFAAIDISSGAEAAFADTSDTLGDYSNHANRTLAIVDAAGLNIASGALLDIGDNAMILKYLAANKAATDTMVNNLLATGCDGGAWDGAGIGSSEAEYDASRTAISAVGWADQNDVGDVSFEGDTADIADGNEIMIKFTYYGDTDVSGTVDATDSANFSLGLHGINGGNAGWEFGDFDYSGGVPNSDDSQAFSLGLHAYRQFGAL